MANNETAHELILQILKTRMTFRQTIQRVLRTNNVDMTFEMLQVMHGRNPESASNIWQNRQLKTKLA